MRQPVPAAQAFVLLFSGLVFVAAQHWAGKISPLQFIFALAVLELIVQPLSYLIHELGHGVAACRLGAGHVSIMVGRGPWMRFSVGRIRINFSPLPSRGVMIGGVCRYDGTLPWRSRALISLSGPGATLLELLAGLSVSALLWPGASTLERNVIVLSLVGLISSLVVNLAPMRVNRNGAHTLLANDGTRARMALRLHREGAPLLPAQPGVTAVAGSAERPLTHQVPPASAGFRSAATQPAGSAAELAQLERARDLERARTSVPPPSSQ